MQPLALWQKASIVGSATTREQVEAMRKMVELYQWKQAQVVDELKRVTADVEPPPETDGAKPSTLTVRQMTLIVQSAHSRDDVAAVIRLVAEYQWIETEVLEALKSAVFRVQSGPPTPRRFQVGLDDLQTVVAEICEDMSNPLHIMFQPVQW